MGSEAGLTSEKILALDHYADSDLFDEREKAALEYADSITLSDRDVDDALFARVQSHFDQAALIELTAAVAWENASSKFNRALRVTSQHLWRAEDGRAEDGELA